MLRPFNPHLFPIIVATLITACTSSAPSSEERMAKADSTAKPMGTAKEGPQVIHLKEGGRMQGEMKAGKRIGPWTSHYPNGTIRSRSMYVDGVEEGGTEVFHDNGMTFYTGYYKAGEPTGEWVYFDPAGKELKRVVYDETGAIQK
jgi:antitoxin component YwqK of YwqJK toxin-antitoxin module